MSCKKIWILLSVLLSWNVHAAGKTAVGAEAVDGRFSFVSAFNHLFEHRPWNRYGHGHIRLKAGTNSGITIRSSGGTPFWWTGNYRQDRTGLFLAIENGNTHVNWTHGDRERDFYNLMPGAGGGAYARMGDIDFTGSVKTGWNITNFYSRRFLHPDTFRWNGYNISILTPKVGFSYDKYFMRDEESSAFSVHWKMSRGQEIVFRQENNSFDRVRKRNVLMFNLEF